MREPLLTTRMDFPHRLSTRKSIFTEVSREADPRGPIPTMRGRVRASYPALVDIEQMGVTDILPRSPGIPGQLQGA